MSLKGLKIKRDKIGPVLEEIAFDHEVKIEKVNDDFFRFVLVKDGQQANKLNVYYLKDGATSITWHECKNKESSKVIAEQIAEKCKFENVLSVSVRIRTMETNSLDELLLFLKDYCGATISDPKNLTNGVQYEVRSVYGDKAYINYYNNKSFNVQGTSEIIEGLSSYLTFGEIVEATLKEVELEGFDKPTVIQLYEARFPNADGYLPETVKNIIIPTFVVQRLGETMDGIEDFSFMVFPILRGVEGCIKCLFLEHGINIDNHIGNQFHDPFKTGNFELLGKHKAVITSLESEILEKLYNYHKNNRHSIFHVDDTIVTTRTVESVEIANSMINEACELIEKCYTAKKENDNRFLR